jgi:tetratricopeptide (TPR) repeat protein
MEALRNLVSHVKQSKNKEEFESAIKTLRSELGKRPNKKQIEELLIELLLAYGIFLSDDYSPNYREGINIFNEIIDLDEKNYRAFYNLGLIYFEFKEMKKALKLFNKALKFNPNYKYAYYNIGIVYEYQNELKKALKFYDKALDIDENFSYAKDAKSQMLKKIE